MSFIKETSDSSRFYRPSSAAGSSDISTTSVPGLLSDIVRVRPDLEVKFQVVQPVYVRPKVVEAEPTMSSMLLPNNW